MVMKKLVIFILLMLFISTPGFSQTPELTVNSYPLTNKSYAPLDDTDLTIIDDGKLYEKVEASFLLLMCSVQDVASIQVSAAYPGVWDVDILKKKLVQEALRSGANFIMFNQSFEYKNSGQTSNYSAKVYRIMTYINDTALSPSLVNTFISDIMVFKKIQNYSFEKFKRERYGILKNQLAGNRFFLEMTKILDGSGYDSFFVLSPYVKDQNSKKDLAALKAHDDKFPTLEILTLAANHSDEYKSFMDAYGYLENKVIQDLYPRADLPTVKELEIIKASNFDNYLNFAVSCKNNKFYKEFMPFLLKVLSETNPNIKRIGAKLEGDTNSDQYIDSFSNLLKQFTLSINKLNKEKNKPWQKELVKITKKYPEDYSNFIEIYSENLKQIAGNNTSSESLPKEIDGKKVESTSVAKNELTGWLSLDWFPKIKLSKEGEIK